MSKRDDSPTLIAGIIATFLLGAIAGSTYQGWKAEEQRIQIEHQWARRLTKALSQIKDESNVKAHGKAMGNQ